MRKGTNPEKNDKELILENYHRIIIPVYIPNLKDDYFKDGLKVLKLCLESLLHTTHSKTTISIINNNCCKEVSDYLETLYIKNSKIDQLLHSKINLGKVNALYSSIKSNLEPIITISDADVLFLPNWQQEVENVLQYMPETGMVSPVPSSRAYSSKFLNSTVYYALFKAKLAFSKVKDPEGMINFQKSIGRESMYNEQHLNKYLTVENDKVKAVVGCGHFVASFRAEVFKSSPLDVCKFKIVGGSEANYLDIPNDKGRFLRLATLGNYAYHLGNTYENWMTKSFEKIQNENKINLPLESLSKAKPLNRISFYIGKVFHIILFVKFKKYFFSFKGMKEVY